jgi:hypothetical protein
MEHRTLNSLFSTLYDAISGLAGPRDWDRLRTIFHPRAMMTRVLTGEGDRPVARPMSVDEYIEATKPFLESRDFFETEIHREVERFGNVAHAKSTYESRWSPEEQPFMTGTNSVQLFFDGERWWIMSMIWDNGRMGELRIDN